MKIVIVSMMMAIVGLLGYTPAVEGIVVEDPLYPGMTIVAQEESQAKAVYKITKWNVEFKVMLTRSPQAVDVKMLGPDGTVVGLGKFGKEGNAGRKLVLRKTAKGIISLWQFAADRVLVKGGTVRLMAMQEEGNQLWTCQYCCYEANLIDEGHVYSDEDYAKEQIKKGKKPHEWGWIYDLPPSSAREAYTDCVDSCLEGGECSDYEW